MIDTERKVIATEQYAEWGNDAQLQIVQTSPVSWSVESIFVCDRGVITKELLRLTKEFGPLHVDFVVHGGWANDFLFALNFAMKTLANNDIS